MPAARNPCPSTSGHFRLNASEHTPAGMSDTVQQPARADGNRLSVLPGRCGPVGLVLARLLRLGG
jgi:hypothetical protein